MRKLTLGEIIYNYCQRNSIDEFDTGNLMLMHNCYDEYQTRDDTTYKPLKVYHPLNVIRSVKLSLVRNKRLFRINKLLTREYLVSVKKDFKRRKLL